MYKEHIFFTLTASLFDYAIISSQVGDFHETVTHYPPITESEKNKIRIHAYFLYDYFFSFHFFSFLHCIMYLPLFFTALCISLFSSLHYVSPSILHCIMYLPLFFKGSIAIPENGDMTFEQLQVHYTHILLKRIDAFETWMLRIYASIRDSRIRNSNSCI